MRGEAGVGEHELAKPLWLVAAYGQPHPGRGERAQGIHDALVDAAGRGFDAGVQRPELRDVGFRVPGIFAEGQTHELARAPAHPATDQIEVDSSWHLPALA